MRASSHLTKNHRPITRASKAELWMEQGGEREGG